MADDLKSTNSWLFNLSPKHFAAPNADVTKQAIFNHDIDRRSILAGKAENGVAGLEDYTVLAVDGEFIHNHIRTRYKPWGISLRGSFCSSFFRITSLTFKKVVTHETKPP
jgi:hypothetical protein